MKESFVVLNDIPTHIITWGQRINEPFSGCKEVILMVTGNPGLPGFYTKFLSTVHQTLNSKIPVWLVGHAGHGEPRNEYTSKTKVPQLHGNEHKYGLSAQVKHKVEFIRRYIPEGVKIHLISHSIGSWITLELLRYPDIKKKIQKCYLLFPAMERMGETPNGRLFDVIMIKMFSVLKIFHYILHALPESVQRQIISLHFNLFGVPKFLVDAALVYVRPTVAEKIVYMAKEEKEQVNELDYENIEKHKDLLKLYYGSTDGWAPTRFYNDLKAKIPDLDAELDTHKLAHAFVLKSSRHMGRIVGNWITQYREY